MKFDDRDELRELRRLVMELQRGLAYTPVRDAAAVELGLIRGVAGELISAGSTGSVTLTTGTVTVRNATGHPVWQGAEVWIDAGRKFIVSTNSANLLWGEWNDSLTKFESDSYALQAANRDFYDGTGFSAAPYDPAGLLADISSSEPWVLFATGEDEPLTVLATSAGGSGGGGGGFEWPGPGEGPEPGTATVSIITAQVDQAGGVTSGDATFPFSGGAAIIGTADATGTADNTFQKAHCHGEDVLLISKNGGGWAALKENVNIIFALVNGAANPTDGTFNFDTATAVEGFAPDGGTGVANNAAQLRWEDNEQFLAIQQDDGDWLPFKIPRLNLITAKVNQSGGVRPADSTFGFDDGAAIQGAAPTGGTGTANNTFGETYADNEVITLVQRSDNGQWETLKKGDPFFVVKGQPSTDITRADGTITCNSPTAVHGKIPVGAITALNNPELKAGSSETIHFVFDLTAGSTNATRWSTAHTKNHLLRLRGYTDYAAATGEYQVLSHDGDGVIRWMDGTLCNPSP